MQPLGTKLKRYSPSDSFCTFLSESVYLHMFWALEQPRPETQEAIDEMNVYFWT